MRVSPFIPINNSAENWKLIYDILTSCGMKCTGFIQTMWHFTGENFFCDIFDDVAFFAAIKTNRHVRLITVAVLSEHQRKGYGRKILFYEMKKAIQAGLREITFRTGIDSEAEKFWRKMGAKITGRKESDWEMKLQF